jgi:hypothetical protein
MGTVLHFRTIRLRAEESNSLKGKVIVRQLVGLPWAADCFPWVGKLEPCYHFTIDDVIRDSAVQLGLTHHRDGCWVVLGAYCLRLACRRRGLDVMLSETVRCSWV